MKSKAIWKKTLILLLLPVLLTVMAPEKAEASTVQYKPRNASYVKGIWVSYFDFKTIGLYNQPEAAFRENAAMLFSNIKTIGCNTVYFHVRMYNDAIYPSKYVKYSTYMGKSLPPYDPLQILIEEAHKQKISFHAWMNPYRVSGTKILNPSKLSTQLLIVNQVKEILKKYKVDGIHFDDYFYSDTANNGKYKNVSIKTRKKYVNQMIRRVYRAVKKYDSRVKFGISPAGLISYCEQIGADVKTWMSKQGYVDYIIPQLYWSDTYRQGKNTIKMFSITLHEWKQLNVSKVPMYTGLGLYKAGKTNVQDMGWSKKNTNIISQISSSKENHCKGYVLFDYTSLFQKDGKKEVKNYLKYYTSAVKIPAMLK